jgi:hypothetical protein
MYMSYPEFLVATAQGAPLPHHPLSLRVSVKGVATVKPAYGCCIHEAISLLLVRCNLRAGRLLRRLLFARTSST